MLAGKANISLKAHSPLDKQDARDFIDRCRNGIVSSDSHLETGHWWSDDFHLDCFKYSSVISNSL